MLAMNAMDAIEPTQTRMSRKICVCTQENWTPRLCGDPWEWNDLNILDSYFLSTGTSASMPLVMPRFSQHWMLILASGMRNQPLKITTKPLFRLTTEYSLLLEHIQTKNRHLNVPMRRAHHTILHSIPVCTGLSRWHHRSSEVSKRVHQPQTTGFDVNERG